MLDDAQLARRVLVEIGGALKAAVELGQLCHDLLRLRLLGADRGVARSRAGYDACRSDDNDKGRRLSLQNPDDGLPKNRLRQAHRRGRYVTSSAGYQGSRTVANR